MEKVDFEYICWLCSPEYLMPRAKKYGLEAVQAAYPDMLEWVVEDSDFLAVIGAFRAAVDSRNNIRSYLKYVRYRDDVKTVDLGLAQAMRRSGWLGSYQKVTPITNVTAWRDNTKYIWPNGGTITSKVVVKIPTPGKIVDAAIVKALSEMLYKYPQINRAFMQNRIWQRTTGHVMINLEPNREQVRVALIDAHALSVNEVKKKISVSTRNLIKAEKTYKEESKVLDTLFRKWVDVGTISSSAGVMVSLVGTKFLPVKGGEGQAALLTNVNGIGIAVTATYPDEETLCLWGMFDHRMFDASHEILFLKYMQDRIPELLKEVV